TILNKQTDYRRQFHDNFIEKDQKDFYEEMSAFYGNGKNLHSFNSIIFDLNREYKGDGLRIPKYDLVLVDEFQDFNELEWQLISILNSKNKVMVVGDDDQSLYDWKRAQPHLIRNLYSDDLTENFSLDYCYRCPRVIVDAVNSLISNAKKEKLLKD